jgi:uncharacterized coiled-coil protein SlyX
MYQPNWFKSALQSARNPTNPFASRRRFFLSALAAAAFGMALCAQAAPPRPDGDIGNGNTAGGSGALISLTTGINNTGIGYQALYRDTTGSYNSALGFQSLYSNTTGDGNSAEGFQALANNTTGYGNTGTGFLALQANTTGAGNAAHGSQALYWNTVGNVNTATGNYALFNNTTGNQNTANGEEALNYNTVGFQNTATGGQALYYNSSGNFNTACGFEALYLNTTGSYNIAVGNYAGANVTTGTSNIDIGNPGVAGDSGIIRIGTTGNQVATFIAGISGATVAAGTSVVIDTNGQLGTIVSSKRFKTEIKPMDAASEAILSLKPVTFRYKRELDPNRIPQFGLVAEEVEKVNPDLVARDAQGKVYTVRYEAVNAMLLNEFLKQHHKMQEQEATITQLKSDVTEQKTTIARQQEGMDALAARLETQASQIQKVAAEVELNRPAPQVVENKQ